MDERKTNIAKYLNSMNHIKKLFENKILNKDEYEKSKFLLKEKYCIKINTIWGSNHLI